MIGRMNETPRGEFMKDPKREIWVYFGTHNGSDTFGAGVCRIPPQSSNEMHAHDEGDEVIYVIKGSMRVIVEGETGVMNQGDGILIRKGQQHQIFNDSKTDEVLHTFTFTPPGPADAIATGYGRDPEKFKIFPPEKK